MSSIRHRLIASLFVSLLLILTASGAVLYGFVRAALLRDLDAGLLVKARALASLVRREDHGRVEFDFAGEFMPEFEKGSRPEYFEIALEDGGVLEKSHSLGAGRLAGVERGEGGGDGQAGDRGETIALPAFVSEHAPRFWDVVLPDGRPGRAVSLRFIPQVEDEHEEERGEAREAGGDDGAGETAPGRHAVVVVARGLEEVQRLLHVLLAVLGAMGVVLPVVVALTAGLIVRRGLGPLDRLAREAASIDSSTLDHRFGGEGMPAELSPICLRLNDLLSRMEKAFARERRFTADVAHELRTPVAELRSMTEVALRDPRDDETTGRTLREALGVALQMEKLIEMLLSIARCEAGIWKARLQTVGLSGACRQAWNAFEARAGERRISMEWGVPESILVSADPDLLQLVLGNLFSNAVEHAPEGSGVACGVERRGDRVCLGVVNAAPDLGFGDLAHLFEPFWRKDASRSDSSHTGLGLALVGAAAGLMDATARASLTDSGALRLEIELRWEDKALL